MTFRVGQQVVCVDATWGCATGSRHQVLCCPNLPTEGLIYTIRSIDSVVAVRGHRATAFIRLVEIANPAASNGTEPYFEAHKYRPLVETKTDISIFKKMLTPASKELCGNE